MVPVNEPLEEEKQDENQGDVDKHNRLLNKLDSLWEKVKVRSFKD